MSSARSTKIALVMIQPTPFCNIDCSYCYLPNRASRNVLKEATLAKIFERLFASSYLGDELSLLWHAGEPLTVPIAFYEHASRLLAEFNRHRVHVRQSLQTNATLITQEWCDLFQRQQIDVGVSIDGPQHVHDANRVTRSGRGTFAEAMRGVRLLRENGIPLSNIAVLSSGALDHADEMWEFFVSEGFQTLSFNVEEAEGVHRQSSVGTAGDFARYQAFFRRLGELRKASGRNIVIRELDHMEQRIRAVAGEVDCWPNRPMAMISFDCDGNIFGFSPELVAAAESKYGDLKFGNVFDCGLDEMVNTARFRAVREEIDRGVARCRAECPYFSVCGGGEPSNKLAENGTFDSTETTHCRLIIQALCDVVLEEVEQSLGVATPVPKSDLRTAGDQGGDQG
jgi:uncharacterized protein